MRRSVIAAVLALAGLPLGGCKRQHQIQQEDLVSLQAKLKVANDHYNAACYAPIDNKAGVDAALGRSNGSSHPLQKPLNFDSPACKQAQAEFSNAMQRFNAAQAQQPAH